MGIPFYFSYIIKEHRTIIKPFLKNEKKINNFYLDSNSIIYDILKTMSELKLEESDLEKFEELLINNICIKIEYYISLINPSDIVFIAFDGIAPVAKLEQQRNRRYKTWFSNEIMKEIKEIKEIKDINLNKWDSCNITPGTNFMKKLTLNINKYFKNSETFGVKNIILSCSNECGEGEHKIFSYIRNNIEQHINTETVIYGLDADLIMLTLNHLYISNKIYLFRETPHFIKNLDNSLNPNMLYLLDIPELANAIVSSMITENNNNTNNTNNQIFSQFNNILFDYILICFLLGNDFLPHFPCINIRTNGINILINAYKQIFNKNNEYLTNNKKIVWKNVRKFIKYLSDMEEENFKNEMLLRDKMEKKYIYNHSIEDKEKKFQLIPIKKRDVEKYINPFMDGWEYRYYKMLFEIDIDDIRKKNICINYLESLEFTLKYYTSGCPDWRWKYKYNYPPLLIDLIKYIPYFNVDFISSNKNINTPISENLQLCYVLPRNSLTLLPIDIYNKILNYCCKENNNLYSLDYDFQWAFCKYFWESHVIMPEININNLEKLILS